MQARHRKEQRELQSRVTNKKKNATKKTRKFVNDECAELERQLKERQETELRKLSGEGDEEEPETLDGDAQEQAQSQDVNGLTNKLESTTLSSSSSQPQQQSSQQQLPKQKRNRQKERLARRAAEQEAAALAAEAEAASMTDHRGREREAMQAAFTANGLKEHEIAPDGHCLFSAVADQLVLHGVPVGGGGAGAGGKEGEREEIVSEGKGTEVKMPPYRVVRKAAADWISRHRDEYAGFLEEGVDEYVGRIRDTAEWGGQLELSALAGAYGVEIRVVQDGRTEVVSPAGREGGEGEVKTLWLAYYRHGYGLGEHYNSLRRV